MEAISPTVLVSIPNATTMPNTARTATNEAGITLVNLGNPQMINIVNNTNPNSIYSACPVNQLPDGSLN